MKFIKNFLSPQFLVFIIIGCINTLSTSFLASVMDKAAFFKTPLAEKLNLTFILGYMGGLVISFFLNSFFTFKEKPTLKKAVKFPISYVPNFIIQFAFVEVFKLFGISGTLAYLFAAVLGIPSTFIIMKLFVFKKT